MSENTGTLNTEATAADENNTTTENVTDIHADARADAKAPQDPLEAATALAKENEQKYLYLYADFENFKKRAVKERSDIMKFGWEGVATELLQVLDNLERALHHAKPDGDQALTEGLKMVVQQFHSSLEKSGVTPVKTIGESFNPEIHEAVAQTPSDLPEGKIVEEHQKGYTLHGRLLRPSRVVVSSGKTSADNIDK